MVNFTYRRVGELAQWGLIDLFDFISGPCGPGSGSTRSIG
jgi:hypothetical protein